MFWNKSPVHICFALVSPKCLEWSPDNSTNTNDNLIKQHLTVQFRTSGVRIKNANAPKISITTSGIVIEKKNVVTSLDVQVTFFFRALEPSLLPLTTTFNIDDLTQL